MVTGADSYAFLIQDGSKYRGDETSSITNETIPVFDRRPISLVPGIWKACELHIPKDLPHGRQSVRDHL